MREWCAHGLLLVVLATISAASLLPGERGGGGPVSSALGNLLHVPAYALLGLVACWSLAPLRSRPSRHLAAVLMLVAFAGGMLEILQPLVGRNASLGDMALNLTGASLAWIGWYVWLEPHMVQRA